MDNSHDFTLRPFAKDDLDAVRELILSTIDTCYTGFYPLRAIEDFEQSSGNASILERAEKGYTIVCECNGRMVATECIVENHICAVFVIRPAGSTDRGGGS